jgi:hypothetical protein
MKETEIAHALINDKDFRNATTAFADNMAQNKELIGKLLPIIDNNPDLTFKRNILKMPQMWVRAGVEEQRK